MRKKFILILFSLVAVINTSSCITPPPGGCAFSNDTDKKGSIQVLAIEEYHGDTLNCEDGKLIKFKFISNNTSPERIYSQAYPSEFLMSQKIEVGKSFNGLKQVRYTGPCRDELFEFTDFPDPYLNSCGNRSIEK